MESIPLIVFDSGEPTDADLDQAAQLFEYLEAARNSEGGFLWVVASPALSG